MKGCSTFAVAPYLAREMEKYSFTAVFTYLDHIFKRSSLRLERRARHKKGLFT